MRTPASCTVLIGAADLLPALKKRTNESGELLTFTDAEALRALDVITKRRPQVVALERLFAATPRGAALINRIKADPALSRTEIRVVSPDVAAPPRTAEPLRPAAAPPAAPDPLTARHRRPSLSWPALQLSAQREVPPRAAGHVVSA